MSRDARSQVKMNCARQRIVLKEMTGIGSYSFLVQAVYSQAIDFACILQLSLQHNGWALNGNADAPVQSPQPAIHVQEAQVQSCRRSSRDDHSATSAQTRVSFRKQSS